MSNVDLINCIILFVVLIVVPKTFFEGEYLLGIIMIAFIALLILISAFIHSKIPKDLQEKDTAFREKVKSFLRKIANKK